MAKIINPNIDRIDREDKIFEFIKDEQFYCAVAYAKVCKFREDEYNKINNTKYNYFNKLYTVLAYAFNDPWFVDVNGTNGCIYSNVIFDYIDNLDKEQDDIEYKIFKSDEFKNFILLAIEIRILYSSESVYFQNIEENINAYWDKIYKYSNNFSLSFIKEDFVHLNKVVEKVNEIYDKVCIPENDDYSDYYKVGLGILKYTVNEIENSISRDSKKDEYKYEYGNNFYILFLLTNDVVLDKNFLPDFPTFYENERKIKNYYAELLNSEFTPEYAIIKHAHRCKNFDYSVSNIRKKLNEKYENEYDNYGILKLIAKYLKIPDYKNDNGSINNRFDKERAKIEAEYKKQDFLGELELSHCYRQFDDVSLLKNKKYNECEFRSFEIYLNIHENIDKWYEWACGDSNYGVFIEIVRKYENAIHYNAEKNLKEYWQQRLDKQKEELDWLTDKHIEKIENLINGHNFSSVSEVFDIVNASDIDDYFHRTELNDFLSNFIDDRQYSNCYNEVELSSEDDLLEDCVDIGKIGDDENKLSAKKLAKIWDKIFSSDENKLYNEDIASFLRYLGFDVNKIDIEPDIKFKSGHYIQSFYNTVVTLRPKKREDIKHTIAPFGSQASKDGFRVICVQGKKVRYEPKNYLIDLIKQIGMNRHTMILLNCRLTIDERRCLAKLIKIQCNEKLFIVVDRVVMAFLMKHYDFNKINEMLMSIVTPFGFYQPYTSNASLNDIPEEMFIGRDKELKEIENPSAPSIVYGGRQLGKSALLRQTEKDIHARNDGSKAVYVDVKGLDYIETVKEIAKQMKDKGILNSDVNVKSWEEFGFAIENLLKSENIPYLLLLIDDADKFFESCNSLDHPDKLFFVIKRILEYYPYRFKVVFAGLNMIREYDFFVKNNSFAAHFGKLAVGPLKFADARELIEKPLHYLGLDFSSDKESLIYLILEITNYYPCLIQLFCEKLLKLMTEDEYAGYSEKDSPIYNISKEHIRKILSDSNFKNIIKNKFELNLRSDNDDYYLYLSLMLALMCHKKYDYYSKDDFRKFAVGYPVEKISKLSDEKLDSLLNQIVDLEVFRKDKQDGNKYGFRRFRLFELMGSEEKVEEQLFGLMMN